MLLHNCSRDYSCHCNANQTANQVAKIYAMPHHHMQPLYLQGDNPESGI